MSKRFLAFSLVAFPLLVHCGDEGSSSTSNTASGGAQPGSGGSAGASAGSSGAAGSSSAGDAGSGGQSGSGGSGPSAGSGGSGTGGGGSGDAGEGGSGGVTECGTVASDGECASCMRENCCEEWQACESDTTCNTCGQCLDEDGSDLATCLVSMDCGDVIQQPVTAAMIECSCGGDLGDCFGPCAAPCGLSPD